MNCCEASAVTRKLRWILRLCALAVLVCGLPQVARAQQGTILGTVYDQTGGVVPNATVTITNTDTNLVTTETTGKEGDYVAPLLIIGHYTIEVKAQGFKIAKQTITLEVGDRRRIDFKLETGAYTEQYDDHGESNRRAVRYQRNQQRHYRTAAQGARNRLAKLLQPHRFGARGKP